MDWVIGLWIARSETWGLFPESPENFCGPENAVVKLQSACFETLIFSHGFNLRKTKRIATFDGSEPRRC